MTDPAFATVRDWCALTGMGRTNTFAAIAAGNIPAVRPSPGKLLIDVRAGLAWLRSLPPAVVASTVRQSSV